VNALENKRGVIQHRERAKQINDFSGLRFGKITPTDIDGLIEYKNKLFIFIEAKYRDTELPFGQRLALERLCDSITDKPCIVFIVSHNEPVENDVDVSKAMLTKYYYEKAWHKSSSNSTLLEAINKFIGMHVS